MSAEARVALMPMPGARTLASRPEAVERIRSGRAGRVGMGVEFGQTTKGSQRRRREAPAVRFLPRAEALEAVFDDEVSSRPGRFL